MNQRSRVHLFSVVAATLEQRGANELLVADFKKLAAQEAERWVRGETWCAAEAKRVDAQRTAFNMVPTGSHKDALKNAMLQRAYNLIWEGNCMGADAVLEFLPSMDVDALLDAFEKDYEPRTEPKSKWYAGAQGTP